MSDDLDSVDQALVQRLRLYAAAGAPKRTPGSVVAAAVAGGSSARARGTASLRGLVAVPLVLAIVAVGIVGFTSFVSEPGSRPARAIVDGTQYDVAVARSLRVPEDVLVPFAQLTSMEGGFKLADNTAYSLPDVDPSKALVLRLEPGQRDDLPLGDYLLLVRGDGAEAHLCPYFDPASPATPPRCR